MYFSCARIPGSLLVFLFFEKDWTTLLACLLASIQKRTSPIKFDHLAEKSDKGSMSNLSTKPATSPAAPSRRTWTSSATSRALGPKIRNPDEVEE